MNRLKTVLLIILIGFLLSNCAGKKTKSIPSRVNSESVEGSVQASDRRIEISPSPEAPITAVPSADPEEPLVISDLNAWNHPVKDLFKDYKIDFVLGKLTRAELHRNRNYMVFFVNLKVSNYLDWTQKSLQETLSDIAAANGWQDYEIRNEDGDLVIKVNCNQKTGSIEKFTINQWDNVNDFLIHDRDRAFNEYLASATSEEIEERIRASGDLDGDGTEEYLYEYPNQGRDNDIFYLLRKENGRYRNLGMLRDDYSVMHYIGRIQVLQLNIHENKRYIIFEIAHTMANAYGYMIYGYNGTEISHVYTNFPGATAYGARELKDTDGDGIYEHIGYYYRNDIQKHLLISTLPFNEKNEEKESYRIEYLNDEKKFVLPQYPTDIVQCYIEANIMGRLPETRHELEQLTDNPGLVDVDLGYKDNNYHYNGIELKYIPMGKTEDALLLKAYDHQDQHAEIFLLKQTKEKWKIHDIIRDAGMKEIHPETLKEIIVMQLGLSPVDLDYAGIEPETGYQVIAWGNPSHGAGTAYHINPQTLDVMNWEKEFLFNIRDMEIPLDGIKNEIALEDKEDGIYLYAYGQKSKNFK